MIAIHYIKCLFFFYWEENKKIGCKNKKKIYSTRYFIKQAKKKWILNNNKNARHRLSFWGMLKKLRLLHHVCIVHHKDWVKLKKDLKKKYKIEWQKRKTYQRGSGPKLHFFNATSIQQRLIDELNSYDEKRLNIIRVQVRFFFLFYSIFYDSVYSRNNKKL